MLHEHADAPKIVTDTAWRYVDSTDAQTRRWAAAAWSICVRRHDGSNEIAILLGDDDEGVRAIGASSLQGVDLLNGAWLGGAMRPLFLAGDPAPLNSLFDSGPLYESSDALRSLVQIAASVLDDGHQSPGAYELLRSLVDRIS